MVTHRTFIEYAHTARMALRCRLVVEQIYYRVRPTTNCKHNHTHKWVCFVFFFLIFEHNSPDEPRPLSTQFKKNEEKKKINFYYFFKTLFFLRFQFRIFELEIHLRGWSTSFSLSWWYDLCDDWSWHWDCRSRKGTSIHTAQEKKKTDTHITKHNINFFWKKTFCSFSVEHLLCRLDFFFFFLPFR